MNFKIHPHAKERMIERGVREEEIAATLEYGEQFPAKLSRIGFRRNFQYESAWHGRFFKIKQVEVYAIQENDEWVVLTVIAKYF